MASLLISYRRQGEPDAWNEKLVWSCQAPSTARTPRAEPLGAVSNTLAKAPFAKRSPSLKATNSGDADVAAPCVNQPAPPPISKANDAAIAIGQ